MIHRSLGPWQIVSTLGQGGMGVVYRAVHGQTGAEAALKTLLHSDANMRWALRREIAALGAVAHPAIIKLLDQGVEGQTPWYAMELWPGPTLATLLGDGGATAPIDAPSTWIDGLSTPKSPGSALPLPPAPSGIWDDNTILRLGWIVQIAHALCWLHAAGLVHCDLKPDNVLVREDRAVLVDFGLVTTRGPRAAADDIAGAARLGGTAAYLAPERARGSEFDARADLYALGCMLYLAIAGSPPFSGVSTVELLVAHLYQPPVDLRDRVRGCLQRSRSGSTACSPRILGGGQGMPSGGWRCSGRQGCRYRTGRFPPPRRCTNRGSRGGRPSWSSSAVPPTGSGRPVGRWRGSRARADWASPGWRRRW